MRARDCRYKIFAAELNASSNHNRGMAVWDVGSAKKSSAAIRYPALRYDRFVSCTEELAASMSRR
jgi:hypothetical protein